jgi:hypothetical protein
MKLARTFCLSFAVLLVVASQAAADRVERATEVVEPDGFEELVVEIDFAAGTIDINGADMDEPARLDVYYTPRLVEYDFDYDKRGKTCRLFIESEIRKNRWDEDELENEWTLQLSKKYRTRLDLDIGACEARFDLGGIPLIDLQIDVGAADMEIDFSEPNPERLREISIDCGASSLKMYGLANANCGRFDFNIGAGSCDLDFRGGEIRGEIEVTINVGMGSMDIIVPRGVAIMVIGDDGWFSSLDFHGLKLNQTRRGDWVSDDFDEAENRIIFDIDVSMGSVDIYAKK